MTSLVSIGGAKVLFTGDYGVLMTRVGKGKMSRGLSKLLMGMGRPVHLNSMVPQDYEMEVVPVKRIKGRGVWFRRPGRIACLLVSQKPFPESLLEDMRTVLEHNASGEPITEELEPESKLDWFKEFVGRGSVPNTNNPSGGSDEET